MQLFEQASARLKNPRIKFTHYQLYRATEKSKYPGAVYVVPPDRQAGWYARIEVDGSITYNKSMSLEGLTEDLQKLAANPQEFAANYGRSSGCCCFCGLQLTDSRSLSVGYGPICADKYGLFYPSKDDAQEEKNPQETKTDYLPKTDKKYNYWLGGFDYSEGVKQLIDEHNCFWLIEDIGRLQQNQAVKKSTKMQEFQIWELKQLLDNSAVLVGSWDEGKVVIEVKRDYIDFPFSCFKLYLKDKILHLPSER